MKIEYMKEVTESFLKSPKIFSKGQCETIEKTFALMITDIQAVMKGEKLEQNTNKFNAILKCLLMVSDNVLNAPFGEDFYEFVKVWAELTYNWNDNVFNSDPVIKHLCLYMSRVAELRGYIIETTDTLKEIDERMKLLSTWSPPSYEIATTYFEKLLEENEKE